LCTPLVLDKELLCKMVCCARERAGRPQPTDGPLQWSAWQITSRKNHLPTCTLAPTTSGNAGQQHVKNKGKLKRLSKLLQQSFSKPQVTVREGFYACFLPLVRVQGRLGLFGKGSTLVPYHSCECRADWAWRTQYVHFCVTDVGGNTSK